eukprot:SAG22_NODE_10226_length_546_cov_1.232662_1_plen_22_part_10
MRFRYHRDDTPPFVDLDGGCNP